MKSVKRIFALLICVIMLASSCLFVNAATVSMSVKNSFSVVSGVSYAKYGVYGSQSGHTENCTVLEFNPNNGYIAMPFIAHAGSANVVATQYSTAVSKYGYSVQVQSTVRSSERLTILLSVWSSPTAELCVPIRITAVLSLPLNLTAK